MKKLLRSIFLSSFLLSSFHSFSQVTLTRLVSAGTDDVEETAPGGTGTIGAMDLTSSDVELMVDGTKQQYIGIRFTNITIPNGATINSAYIQFATKGDKVPVSGTITIKGEDVDNSATYTTANFGVSTRTATTQSVSWPGSTDASWGTSAGGTQGVNQRTPSLVSIVQQLVNRTGWTSGNSMNFILNGAGVRNAYTFDGAAPVNTQYAPQLVINYTAVLPPMPIINFPVPKLAQWYYLDNGSNQGTAWQAPAFNHSAWMYGPGKLGYSDAPATTLSYGPDANNKYITYYFRKQFNVASVSALNDTLQLNLLRDDGAIVYINGVEVLRDNMPSTGVDYLTWSTATVDGANESTYFSYNISKNFLVNGQNTIAVEIHQRDGTSSDLGFDLELKELPPASLSRGPYLQKATSSSMNVRWRTDVAAGSILKYGTHPDSLNTTLTDLTSVTEHEMAITGLQPHTKYWYKIETPATTLQGDTNNYFMTLPTPGSTDLVRIGVIGDCGNNSTNQVQVRNQLVNYLGSNYMDSWILLGDNAYSSGTDAEFQAEFFNIYKDRFLKQNPLFPAPGNHDYSNGSSTAQNDHNIPYYSIFTMPTNGESGGTPSNNEAYYSFDVGNVHFLSLDSYGEEDAGTTRLYDTLGAQVQWIKQDLNNNVNKDWIVAYWHHPPYTKGSHNSDTENELVQMRQKFIQILERYGVDLILCGHSHDYERSALMKGHYGLETTFNANTHNISNSNGKYDGSNNSCPYIKNSETGNNGTVYVVSGSAGQLGGTTSGYPHNAMQYSNATNGGSMILEVQGNRMDAKWICADGVIRDKFTIMKDVNESDTTTIFAGNPDTLTASWIGAYVWNTAGATTQQVIVTPSTDTLIEVRDSLTNTCLLDQHLVNVVDSPKYTTVPTALTASTSPSGCDTTIEYDVLVSGAPTPTLTYTLTGATSASGNGIGSGLVFNKGITTVVVSAQNAYGTKDTSFTVTVNDTYLPAITAPTDLALNNDNNSCEASGANLGTPTYADNCGNVTIVNDAPATYPVGTTTVTWTATDDAGNATTATQLVVVTDNQLPTITAPAAVTVNSDAGFCSASNVALGTPVTGDNCMVDIVSNDAPNQFNAGNTTVTWTVTDASGNTATAIQTVTVIPTHMQWTGTVDSLWSNAGNWDCGVLPTTATDVLISPAAINMPVVDITNAAANNVTIDAGASLHFIGATNVLEAKGDITANGQFIASNGKVLLSGNGEQSIPGGTYRSIDVQGGSEKTIGGNVVVMQELALSDGFIRIGSNNLTLEIPASMTGGSAQSFIITDGSGSLVCKNMGTGMNTSEVLFPVGTASSSYTPLALTNTGTADDFSVRVIPHVFDGYNNNTPYGFMQTENAVDKTWLINEATTGGSIATVKPFWNAADELPIFDRNACNVSHYDVVGNAWMPGPTGIATFNTLYAHTMNVTSFSPFGVGSASSPLDINLLNFTAIYIDPAVKVDWETAMEHGVINYEVERSPDAAIFNTIAAVQPGNQMENSYGIWDKEISGINANQLYYRLKIYNTDGSHSYSKTVKVDISKNTGNNLTLLPNPVRGKELTLNQNITVTEEATITIFAIDGKEVAHYSYATGSFGNRQTLDVSMLAPGVYMLNFRENGKPAQNIKFTRE